MKTACCAAGLNLVYTTQTFLKLTSIYHSMARQKKYFWGVLHSEIEFQSLLSKGCFFPAVSLVWPKDSFIYTAILGFMYWTFWWVAKNHIKREDCGGRLFLMGNCNFSGFFMPEFLLRPKEPEAISIICNFLISCCFSITFEF